MNREFKQYFEASKYELTNNEEIKRRAKSFGVFMYEGLVSLFVMVLKF